MQTLLLLDIYSSEYSNAEKRKYCYECLCKNATHSVVVLQRCYINTNSCDYCIITECVTHHVDLCDLLYS